MARLSPEDLAAIRARCEQFIGPEAEEMKFAEYSDLYDQFVREDLPRLMEYVTTLESENEGLRGVIRSSRLRAGRRGR